MRQCSKCGRPEVRGSEYCACGLRLGWTRDFSALRRGWRMAVPGILFIVVNYGYGIWALMQWAQMFSPFSGSPAPVPEYPFLSFFKCINYPVMAALELCGLQHGSLPLLTPMISAIFYYAIFFVFKARHALMSAFLKLTGYEFLR